MKPKIYAYLRVSTDGQNIDNSKHEILNKLESLDIHGYDINDPHIFWVEEKKSGCIHFKKRKLGQTLNIMSKGDILICSEVSRIGRKITDIMEFFNEAIKKSVRIYFTKTDIKIDDSIQSQILIFAYSMASQIERDLISSRTKSALQTAKRNGKKLGRPKNKLSNSKLLPHKNDIQVMLSMGVPKKYIADKFKVCFNTLQSFIKREKLFVYNNNN